MTTSTPNIEPEPLQPIVEPLTDHLTQLATCIRDYEGKPGDLNYRNNNPGNCRFYKGGYAPIYGVVENVNGFAKFKTYDLGFLYLKNMIKGKIIKNPNQTLFQFMTVYAPDNENDPVAYANWIAHRLGVTVDYKMKMFL